MFLQRYFLNFLLMRDMSVLIDLFEYKNVRNADIYHCFDDKTAVLMCDAFNVNNIRVSIKNVQLLKKLHTKDSYIMQGYEKVGVVIDASCHRWTNIFNGLDENAFKSPFVWFIVTKNVIDTTEVLSRCKIGLNSDVTVITKQGGLYKLFEVYNTGYNKNGEYIVRDIGIWNGTLHIEIKDRMNLRGLVLKAAIDLPNEIGSNKSFVEYLDEAKPDLIKVDPMHRYKSFTAFKYFRDMFNITYDFQPSNSWGYLKNGSFDGIVGALQRYEVDISATPLFIRSEWTPVVDYAAETWLTRPCFIFRHPKYPDGYYSIYTNPFTKKVWYCVIFILAISSVMLAILIHINILKEEGDEEDMTLSLGFLLTWSAVCQQATCIYRSSNAIKMVIFTLFLFSLTIYQYYIATWVSTLLYERIKTIKTLQDLSKTSLSAGVEDVMYNRDYFQHTTDPVAREIYLKKVVFANSYKFHSAEQGLAMVKEGGFAFHIDSAVAYRIMRNTFTEKELCELQEVPVFESYLGLAVCKQSPYIEIMAYGVAKLRENGILYRLSKLWDEPPPPCVVTPDSSMISVNILEFSLCLYVLAFGFVLSVLILYVELLVFKFSRCYVTDIRDLSP